jgi:hypothetical protein
MNAPVNMVALKAMAAKEPKKVRPTLRGGKRAYTVKDGVRGKESGEKLRQEVRRACLEKFKQYFGFDWSLTTERQVLYNADPDNLETEARKVWKELRAAMLRAVEFADKNPVGFGSTGRTRNILAWWVPEHVAPLTKHSVFEFVADDPIYDASRVRMIRKFEQYDMLGLSDRGMRISSFLTYQELAVISLLSGTSEQPELAESRDAHWPVAKKESMTVAAVFRRENDTMARLLRSHGKVTVSDSNYAIVPVIRGK